MNEKWKKLGVLFFLFSIPALMFIYPNLNSPYRGVHTFVTNIDKSIPFIKAFVIPYAAWVGYITISLIYLCLKDHKLAFKTILVFDLGLLICFIIYYFYQTEGPIRPVLIGHDFLSKTLEYIYGIDHPFNSFPSIHAMSSYLLIRAIRNCSWINKWHRWIVGCFSTSIILATMFIKQHAILDVLVAILLVECLFNGLELLYRWVLLQNHSLKEVAKKPSSFSA
ncbi:MAG: phosphatase PAP2 family protein [Bacillota bacterium]|nr:phosphatase PAP2 family protein [Bacillota bacterium]